MSQLLHRVISFDCKPLPLNITRLLLLIKEVYVNTYAVVCQVQLVGTHYR